MEAQTQNRKTSDLDDGIGLQEAIAVPRTKLSAVGGGGGNPFDDPLGDTVRIAGLNVGSGQVVDSIQMVVKVGVETLTLQKRGGGGGTVRALDLLPGEFITKVEVNYGEVIDKVTFHIFGRAVPVSFGGRGGKFTFTLAGPDGTEVCGFHGRAGESIDCLGIYYRERAKF